jgi:thioredoxin reductase (NADPH)
MKEFDVIILGAGPAGLSAAIYLARANVNCCIIDTGLAGGRPNGYLEIENYLGLGKISTAEMIDKFIKHVEEFKVPIYDCEEILSVNLKNKIVTTTNDTYEAMAIIIATGSKPRLLNVPGEKEFTGKGVHYCAICDGHFYKDKVVTVVGGGNSACEEALGLAKIAKKVIILQDLDELTGDSKTVELILDKENIEVIYNVEIQSIDGGKHVEAVTINRNIDSELNVVSSIFTDAVFPYIGFTPNSEMFNVSKGANGFIRTTATMLTSVDGVYAVGDVRDKVLRQVVTAVSDGAIAGVQVSQYLRLL